jgi:flagellar protein FliS
MDEAKKNEFTQRIGRANKTEMIVVVYDIALEYALDAKEAFAKSDMEAFARSLTDVRKCVDNLIDALNFDIDISNQLFALYNYIKKCLLSSRIDKNEKGLDDSVKLLTDMKEIFVELAKQDSSAPVSESGEHVVTGMTYGRGVLNDSVVNSDPGRGFSV